MAKNTNGIRVPSVEIELEAMKGMPCLIMNIIATLAALVAFIFGVIMIEDGRYMTAAVLLTVIGAVYAFLVGPMIFPGFKVLKPNEALVLTLFGRYIGTLKGEGFYWVNPFCIAVNPAAISSPGQVMAIKQSFAVGDNTLKGVQITRENRKLSLKVMTLNN